MTPSEQFLLDNFPPDPRCMSGVGMAQLAALHYRKNHKAELEAMDAVEKGATDAD